MAQLCTLDLLRSLSGPQTPGSVVSCVTFAAPAVGNAALAELVNKRGWRDNFVNYLLPGGYPVALFHVINNSLLRVSSALALRCSLR